jgi:hypothetical protein
MTIRYSLEHEAEFCAHYEKEILRADGSTVAKVNSIEARGVRFEVIKPGEPDEETHNALYLDANGKIEIGDWCDEEPCVHITYTSRHGETNIYLPNGITLTELDAAICSAIMAKRVKEEGR